MSAAALLTPVLVAASSGSSKSTSSGSSVTFVIFLVVIGVIGYFFLLRPQQQKARRQRQQASEIAVGDEILTVGGIVGRVVELDSERVTVVSGGEVAGAATNGSQPTRLVLVRNAIARKIEPPPDVAVPSSDFEAGSADREVGNGVHRPADAEVDPEHVEEDRP